MLSSLPCHLEASRDTAVLRWRPGQRSDFVTLGKCSRTDAPGSWVMASLPQPVLCCPQTPPNRADKLKDGPPQTSTLSRPLKCDLRRLVEYRRKQHPKTQREQKGHDGEQETVREQAGLATLYLHKHKTCKGRSDSEGLIKEKR